jgi:hypothetical protein
LDHAKIAEGPGTEVHITTWRRAVRWATHLVTPPISADGPAVRRALQSSPESAAGALWPRC